MSCGKHHDVNCQEILDRVYVFLDNELDEATCHEIRAHLAECEPCLGIVDVERMVKALIARSCTERAPVELRERVLISLRTVSLQSMPAAPETGVGWLRGQSARSSSPGQFSPPELPGL